MPPMRTALQMSPFRLRWALVVLTASLVFAAGFIVWQNQSNREFTSREIAQNNRKFCQVISIILDPGPEVPVPPDDVNARTPYGEDLGKYVQGDAERRIAIQEGFRDLDREYNCPEGDNKP